MKIFIEWTKDILEKKTGKKISIDGKAIKSATDKINNGNIPYIVSAFIGEIGLSIGEVKVDDKSNEITAIPDLLDLLDIEGATITIDAIGTQEDIVNNFFKFDCIEIDFNIRQIAYKIKYIIYYTSAWKVVIKEAYRV